MSETIGSLSKQTRTVHSSEDIKLSHLSLGLRIPWKITLSLVRCNAKNSISITIGLSTGSVSQLQCIKCHLTVPINSGSWVQLESRGME